MYVASEDEKIEYVAATPYEVPAEIQKLYSDLDTLLKLNLSFKEVFYFASMIHLVFVKIHPWKDGNGRSARLIEKWFISEKLGQNAWFVKSEKNYYYNHQIYYKNIRFLDLVFQKLTI